jgi:RNA polymerase sigma factor (sigma-70 family)
MRDVRQTIEAVGRIEWPRLVAGLTRLVRDVGVAEDAAQEALLAALEQWPASGIPSNPGAWLRTTGKRRAIDHVRRDRARDRSLEALGRRREAREEAAQDLEMDLDDEIGDDVLRLMFLSCHPALSPDARVALTLRLSGGLDVAEIARGFLVPEATISQRLVRAKRTLRGLTVPFEVPRGALLAERLPAVLDVLYLVFNEGYAATSGEDWMRPTLCVEALRLARVLAGRMPEEPEALGLVALMELQASRFRARVDAAGRIVRLFDQDRTRWDGILVARGLRALERAARLGGPRGRRVIEAEIAACHARARAPRDTDWARIVRLYDELAGVAPSPVVALNRAVAVGMASGPEAGLERLDAVRDDPALRDYHLLPAVRGDLLERLGRRPEARAEFERAAALASNARERELLLDRARAVAGEPQEPDPRR